MPQPVCYTIYMETTATRESKANRQSQSFRHRAPSRVGWFASESMIRRIGQEALVLLGGGRAVLLQLAHPLVAAGVADFSDFQTDPLSRFLHTLEAMHTLVFGSAPEAEGAMKHFHAVHARIQGRLVQAAGHFPAGTPYDAADPELKLWVHATLVDTSLITYQRFVGRLRPNKRQDYYTDTYRLARRMGIPERLLPPTLDDFKRYMAHMLAGDTLAITGMSRRLAWQVLRPNAVGPLGSMSAHLLGFVAAGLLPQRLRREYGLQWGTRQQVLLEGLSRTTCLLRRVAPPWVWQSPYNYDGLARLLLVLSRGAAKERRLRRWGR
jgi:uncharacterized protein (DUF2236 family)